MHRALLRLIILQWRGRVRYWLRGLRTWKGALFSTVGLLVFATWLIPQIFYANRFGGSTAMPWGPPGKLQTAVPFLLLGYCLLGLLTSGVQGAIPFLPAEILFLFAGPFTRRQLLAYKILAGLAGGVFTALFVSIFLAHYLVWWAAFVGSYLTWLFLNLVPKAVFLLKQTVAEHAYTRWRKAVVVGVIALILWACAESVTTVPVIGFWEFLERVRQSWAGAVLLAPFEAFSRMLFAETIVPGFVTWAGVTLAIDLTVVGLVFWLDANYLAAADEQSRRNYERRQRARRGDVFGTAARSAKAGAWIRPLPWLAGAGPIGWQQLVTVVRTAGGAITVMVVVALSASLLLYLFTHDSESVSFVVWVAFAYSVFFLPMLLRFDFRASLDRMDLLKTLPLHPGAIACGQLLTPVLFASAIQIALFVGAIPFLDGQRWMIPIAVAFVLPFNLVFFGVENFIFLLFPTAQATVGTGGLQNMGRGVVTMLVKLALLTAFCAPAAALGSVGYWLAGGFVALLIAWHILAGAAVAVVPCVAWAFRSFDPSVDKVA